MDYFTIILIALTILFLCGISHLGGRDQARQKFEQDAIDNGYAQFNSKTKEFEWLK